MNHPLAKAFLRIVLPYAVFAGLWILLSDWLLGLLPLDVAARTQWSIYKGWAFVLVTASLLSMLLHADLTARARDQAALRNSEERLRLLGDNLPDSYVYQYTYENGGAPRFLYLSAGVERQHGVKAEDVMRDATVLHRQIAPELMPALQATEAASLQSLTDFTMELRMRRSDGEWRWVRVHSRPRRASDGQVLWDGVATDITESKRADEALRNSEERLRLAAQAARMGMWDRDIASNRLFWSAEQERLMGYEPGTFPGTDEAFMELLHPDSLAVYAEAHQRARTGDGIYQAELHFRCRDGRERWGLMQGRTHFDREGKPERIIGVDVDITERKRAEAERIRLEAQMRHQQKLESLGTLAGGVAHEINNPINGIMNYAQLIQDRLPSDSPLTEYTGEILHETQRVAAIVYNLLTFAQDGRLSHSPARLPDIVEGTVSLIRTAIEREQILLQVDVPPVLPELRCRSQQIQQVLMNLMTNARDALNERYPGYDADKMLRVSAHLFEKDGRGWIRVTVEDHGTGIRPEVRDRMFDPFFTTKPRNQSTGLGLAISHEIVKNHHGEMTVETEPGRFTRVHVDLPVDNL